jgi:alpha-galactosidase
LKEKGIKKLIENAKAFVRSPESASGDESIIFSKVWEGDICYSTVTNKGSKPVEIREIVLFKGEWDFRKDIKFYGEGYSMLSQYGGTLDHPVLIGGFDDRKHYKFPATEGFFTVYNFAVLSPEASEHILLGFASCRRFTGEIRLGDGEYEIVLDGENLILKPGESWKLEEFCFKTGFDRELLLEQYAERIELAHSRLPVKEIPTGWCSWYCFGPSVREEDIFANLEAIAKDLPELKYIQIDDGYQAYMGDWLIPGKAFNDMEKLCLKIKERGFEPAIWVAPFIAEKDSELFKQHPNWFIKDENNKPLSSNEISFGGWRHSPWYMLDGTNPEARQYLVKVFRTMREKWGCRYFKLDANMWGALPGGKRYLREATKVEAYRMGMEAVLEGAGEDSFLLGCNAPMWPSLGTVHGMRITGDIKRTWDKFKKLAQEGFYRNWQHNRLWVNDPDCILLENRNIKLVEPDGTIRQGASSITEDEFKFHTAYIYASGGMILSGDDTASMSAVNKSIINEILKTKNIAARFDDDSFRIGRIIDGDDEILCLFNWGDSNSSLEVKLKSSCQVVDYWTGKELGAHIENIVLKDMPLHSSRMLVCKKVYK